MKDLIELTKLFHVKHGFTVGAKLEDCKNEETNVLLDRIATMMLQFAKQLESLLKPNVDERIPRVQLMIEELGESIEAMAHRDEVALLDGLSDLMFVTMGTAIALDLPLEAGVLEVCNSNLTKATRQFGDDRLRDKGTSYKPPNMAGVIEVYRRIQEGASKCNNQQE